MTFEVDGLQVRITRHAAERIVDMAVSAEEVMATLQRPETVINSLTYEGCQNYRRGDLALGVRRDGTNLVVITALWSSNEAWQRDFDKTGDYGDRHRRATFGNTA